MRILRAIGCALAVLAFGARTFAQGIPTHRGDPVPPEVETIYLKGLNYLAKTQTDQGCWSGTYGGQPAVVGLAVLAALAHGDDPNVGPYSVMIKRAVDFLLKSANPVNGYIGTSMYNHGFATLALAEAYGAVNDERIGPALNRAVSLILTSQASNPLGAWRYSPEGRDADTTVSGAQMVALLAARNAGIGVPDKAVKKGLDFFTQCQSGDGGFGYTSQQGSGGGPTTAIGALVFALAKQKNSPQFKASARFLNQFGFQTGGHEYYYLYYASQALFQSGAESWDRWNRENIRRLAATQNADGSWSGGEGESFCTPCSLLSLALNYRFLPIYER